MWTSRKTSLALFLLLLPAAAFAQLGYTNPTGLVKPPGYTHVVTAGNTIYISGQVAMDAQGNVIGKGDLRVQAVKVYQNLERCLSSVGLAFADVIKMNIYVVNLKPGDVTILREVRKQYLSPDTPPASTLVGVTALAGEDLLLEIEAVAVRR